MAKVVRDPVSLSDYNKDTIKAYCEQYGLDTSGTKDELLARLAESDEAPWNHAECFGEDTPQSSTSDSDGDELDG